MSIQQKKNLRQLASTIPTPKVDTALTNEDYIAHHGILGMKWGIRRFQNKDGSLTSAGRKRYGVGEGEESSDTGLGAGARNGSGGKKGIGVPIALGVGAAAASGIVSGTRAGLGKGEAVDSGKGGKKGKGKGDSVSQAMNKEIEALRQYRNAGTNNNNDQNQNRYNTRKTLSQKEMDAMSDKELQQLVSRLNLETNYSRLTQEPAQVDRVDAGLQRAQAVLTIIGTSVTIAAAGAKIAQTLSSKSA